MLCSHPGYLLAIKTADCLPVFIVDHVHSAIAAVHCGWRGTGLKLIQKVVQRMQAEFGSQPKDLQVGMGPSIEQKCYEVGEDVRANFLATNISAKEFFPVSQKPGTFYLDLKSVNKKLLLEMGIRFDNIFSIDKCTFCEADLFSYRREQQEAGRLLNFIAILK